MVLHSLLELELLLYALHLLHHVHLLGYLLAQKLLDFLLLLPALLFKRFDFLLDFGVDGGALLEDSLFGPLEPTRVGQVGLLHLLAVSRIHQVLEHHVHAVGMI